MTVYADTSVIGGCFDVEFQEWSNLLMSDFVNGSKMIMLSDLTLQELEMARQEIRDKIKVIPKGSIIPVGIIDRAIHLAETYISEGALTNKSYNDALHIALATLSTMRMFWQVGILNIL
jgi:hypothetical protein